MNEEYKNYFDIVFTYKDFIDKYTKIKDSYNVSLILAYMVLNNYSIHGDKNMNSILSYIKMIPIKDCEESLSFFKNDIDKLIYNFDNPDILFSEYLINTKEFDMFCKDNKKEVLDIVNNEKELLIEDIFRMYDLDIDNYNIYWFDNYIVACLKDGNEVLYIKKDNFDMISLKSINGVDACEDMIRTIYNQNDNDYKMNVIGYNLDGEEVSFVDNKNNMFKKNGMIYIEKFDNENERERIYTPVLDKYGIDMTNCEYLIDPSIGREDEIRKIEQILLYPEKDKSIIIVGDSGIGKTSLVRGLSYRVQKGCVPSQLKNLKIVSIDVSTMVSGTKYVGTLEEKLKNILDEASSDKNIIIFIDEIHQAISGGVCENDSNSVAEILKPYLDFGKTRVIGCTTSKEYDEEIEKNQAFKTRFKKIKIDEPNDYVIYDILNNLIDKYNEISYSKLDCSNDERNFYINSLIEVTNKKHRDYFDRESNPRLVLDILKEVYAIANINERESISKYDFIEAISNEERLGNGAKEDIISKIENCEFDKNNCRIIKFRKNK